MFFYSGVSHVGLYVGDGRMIHAPHPGAPVRIAPIDQMPFAAATRPHVGRCRAHALSCVPSHWKICGTWFFHTTVVWPPAPDEICCTVTVVGSCANCRSPRPAW